MSLFLKSEKIPALLYVGDLSTCPSVSFDRLPWPNRPRAQILNH
jgi:hypothetical protein